jgi:hypothetical protein
MPGPENYGYSDGRRRFEFGGYIERKTVRTLKTSPEVLDATKVPGRNKELQEAGIDIVVKIPAVTTPTEEFDEVYVQVKSNAKGIRRFRRHIAEKNQLIPEQVDTWLLAHRYIVVNGNQPENDVLTSFRAQLGAIIDFHIGKASQ